MLLLSGLTALCFAWVTVGTCVACYCQADICEIEAVLMPMRMQAEANFRGASRRGGGGVGGRRVLVLKQH
jgi:hypothetical protein